ncbi:hypothetical protein ACI0FQ_05645, partial [Bacillus velezensis]
ERKLPEYLRHDERHRRKTAINEPHDRQEWRARVAHFRDPDNNLIEIYKMI